MAKLENWISKKAKEWQSNDVVGAVLCAGLGTRLRPATLVTPKPGVPFLNRAIALHSVKALAQAGIKHIGVNVHHLPDAMLEALKPAKDAGLELVVSREEGEILGTGGGLREIWRKLGPDKTVVLCHGDVVLGQPLGPILAAHMASGAEVSLVLKVRDGSTTLRGVFTDASGRVSRILRTTSPAQVEPVMEHAFTGIHILSPSVFKELGDEGPSCLVTEVYPKLLKRGAHIAGALTTAFYADLGTPKRFLDAQRDVFEGPARLSELDWPTTREAGIYIGPEVEIDPRATLTPPCRVEGAVRISAGARLGPNAALCGNISLSPNAHITDAAVWGEGEVNGEIINKLEVLGGGS